MYQATEYRYDSVEYKCSGRSGVLLPRVLLGLWQNFGFEKSLEEQKAVLFRVSDVGTTHLDLVNDYGFPAVGKAEEDFDSAPRDGLGRYRDELFISTRAGFDLWPEPYDNWGSRKYLMASLDSSLERMGLEYMDVFYHHRSDPETSLERTMGALSGIVHQGKTLYMGIFNYQAEKAEVAIHILRENKAPCLLHQPWYNVLERWMEDGPLELLDREDVGCTCYSPLAQGTLTGRYLNGIPEGSRALKKDPTVGGRYLTGDKLVKIRALDRVAGKRGQSLTRVALAWALRRKEATGVLIGAGSIVQLEDNIGALDNLALSHEELAEIGGILKG